MNFSKKLLLSLLALGLVISVNLQAQTLKTPAPSPLQTIKQNFGLGEVSIEYSRPSAKGRVIFGDVVSFGNIWRTGANSATKITIAEDTKIEGNAIAAGTYAIYTLPGKDAWDIMFYKDLTLGGNVGEYKKEDEVLRISVKPSALTQKVETFTINFADMTATTCNVELVWEQTRVAFKLSTEIDTKVMKSIETAMAPADKRPYFSAASYYYDNNKDMKQALEWIDKAVEQNPKAYWVLHLKAKIQLKLKDAKGAIETAEKSKALALEDKDEAYVKNNDKLIAEAKGMK
jgi:tetratricopeptide (TPR) repeat protein